jgi:hypothetical protein
MPCSLPRCLLVFALVAPLAVRGHVGAQTQTASAQGQKPESKRQSATMQNKPEGAKKNPGSIRTQPGSARAQERKSQPQSATAEGKSGSTQTQSGTAQSQSSAGTQKQSATAETEQAGAQTQPEAVQIPLVTSVNIFQTTETSTEEGTFYLEIVGQSLPTVKPGIFIAPQEGLADHTTEVISSTASRIVARFSASKGYFPSSIAVAGTGVVSNTFDVSKTADVKSKLPRIDDVEILQMDRTDGTGSIKIDGSNFGSDPGKIGVVIVPREPGFPAFAMVSPTLDSGVYVCPNATPDQMKAPISAAVATNDVVVANFSFACTYGYSTPFVIARVVLTVPGAAGQPASSVSYEMLPARDKNLTYRSTILSSAQAKSRFGGGIAANFYVVQLSIVNQGATKVQIPLASIQAEVQWYAGSLGKRFYLAGPATVAPVPLAGAVSYFSTHRQATGARARFFNALQGATTIGSAIQLFFGPGFAQGVGIAGGGFRQGLGQIFQDMSDQQLANLTSQSFESIEAISGNGGSIEKVIFIQRGEEKLPSSLRRLITNINGFEITGYEVPQTPSIAATPKP